MKSRRFVFFVFDPLGHAVRKIVVSRSSINYLFASGLFGLIFSLIFFLHSFFAHKTARESLNLAEENRELALLIDSLSNKLAEARRLEQQTELAFVQMHAKSGLTIEPAMLGIGPYQAQRQNDGWGINVQASSTSGLQILSTPPVALSLELQRLSDQGNSLQNSLGDTLEYFNDAEKLLSNTPSIRPTQNRWFTSSFGRRSDPWNGSWVMHKGIDLGGQMGEDIYAPADGVVIFTGWRGGYGLTVVVDHGYDIQTHFAHLSRARIANGDRVRRGDIIASMGTTGRSTGPHLHYEVRRDGQPLDPRVFILD